MPAGARFVVFFFNSEVVYLINEVKTVTVNTRGQETKHLFIKIERSMHVFIITQLEQTTVIFIVFRKISSLRWPFFQLPS